MAEKRKLLVADDEEMIREAVASYLESQGYQVFRAENGEEALNILKREPISLVILDLMLPDLPGEEVCVRIRKQSRVPIIMLTAKNVEYDMIHGLDLGADDYITKPFSLKNLSCPRAGGFAALDRGSGSACQTVFLESGRSGDRL